MKTEPAAAIGKMSGATFVDLFARALIVPAMLAVFLLAAPLGLAPTPAWAASFLERAQQYFEEGDLRSAAVELKNALQRDPDNAQARYLRGKVLLQLGDPASAEKELLRARDLGMQGEELDLMLAYARLEQQRFNDIVSDLSDEITIETELQKDLYVARGEALLGLGQIEEAQVIFDRILLEGPHVRALVNKARIAIFLDEQEAARGYLDQAAAINPDDPLLATINAGWLYQAERFAEAKDGFARAVELNPFRLAPYVGQIQSHLALGEFDQADRLVQSLKAKQPDNNLVVLLESITQYQLGNYQNAKLAADRVLAAKSKQLQALEIAGYSAYNLGDYEQSRAHLLAYLAQRPQDDRARMMLSAALLRLGYSKEAFRTARAPEDESSLDNEAYLTTLLSAAFGAGERAQGLAYLEQLATKRPDSATVQERLGVARILTGDSSGGMAALKRSIELDPAGLSAYRQLFLLHLRENELNAALAVARSMQSTFPDDGSGYSLAGLAYLAKEDHQGALTAFQEALAKDPGDASAANNLAALFENEGAHDEAREVLTIHLKAKPDDFQTAGNLAALEVRQGNDGAAKRILSEILEKEPRHFLTLMRLGFIAQRQQNVEEASQLFKRASVARPNSLRAHVLWMRTLLVQEKNEQALSAARPLLINNKDSASLVEVVGTAQMGMKRYKEAIVSFEKLTKIAPESADAYLLLAQAYSAADRPEDVTLALEKAITLDPSHERAGLTYARYALLSGDLAKAEQIIDSLRPKAEDNPEFLLLSGRLAAAQDDLKLAIGQFAKAADAYPADKPLEQANAVGLLSWALWEDQRPQQSIDILKHWLVSHPEDLQARLVLAARQAGVGQNDDAEQNYFLVLQGAPQNWLAHLELAALLYNKGDSGKAQEHAEKAVEFGGKDDLSVVGQVSRVYLANSAWQQALPLLEHAHDLDPSAPTIGTQLAQALDQSGRHEDALTLIRKTLAEHAAFPNRAAAVALEKKLTSQ